MATVTGPAEMLASDVVVPGDPSSAAFVAAAALLKPGSSVTIQNVSLNPARIGFVRTLERMGADIRESYGGHEGKEPRGTITVNYTPVLRGCEIPSQHIASVIDEIPVLALVAAHARGITVFHEVGELRVKESDRLQGHHRRPGPARRGRLGRGRRPVRRGQPAAAGARRASSSNPTATIVWP